MQVLCIKLETNSKILHLVETNKKNANYERVKKNYTLTKMVPSSDSKSLALSLAHQAFRIE